MTSRPYPDFLATEFAQPSPETARFHIIPVPFEKSVSYGGGTAGGPSAILEASLELEAFDGTSIPGNAGIYTAPPIVVNSPTDLISHVSAAVKSSLDLGKIPILLGGEHTVSVGAFSAISECSEEVGIIQFDAHADLRDTYQGSPYSHACVMHRALDMGLPIIQIGVRSLSHPEHLLRESESIHTADAHVIAADGPGAFQVPEDFPAKVYITIDVDAFDPSIMPATGTPEPGGLGWYDVMTMLETITKTRQVVGLDCVELSPVPGLHAPDFTVARLLYNLMGLIVRN